MKTRNSPVVVDVTVMSQYLIEYLDVRVEAAKKIQAWGRLKDKGECIPNWGLFPIVKSDWSKKENLSGWSGDI